MPVPQNRGLLDQHVSPALALWSEAISCAASELLTQGQCDLVCPEGGIGMADELRDELIRMKAFYIWLDEGRPEGRADVHWQMASDLIANENANASVHCIDANKRV